VDKRPLNLGRVIIDRNIYGLFIKTKEGLRSIAKIFNMLSDFGLVLVHMINSKPITPDDEAFLMFLDFSRSEASPTEVKAAKHFYTI